MPRFCVIWSQVSQRAEMSGTNQWSLKAWHSSLVSLTAAKSLRSGLTRSLSWGCHQTIGSLTKSWGRCAFCTWRWSVPKWNRTVFKFRAFLFLFWFAKVGAFNSWLLPKLAHFCKQNTDNSPLRYGTNTIHIREKEKKVVSIFGNRVFMFFIEEPRIVCHVLCSKDLFSPPESWGSSYVLTCRLAELIVKLIVLGKCDDFLAPTLHHCSLSPYSSSSLFPTSSATCLVAF